MSVDGELSCQLREEGASLNFFSIANLNIFFFCYVLYFSVWSAADCCIFQMSSNHVSMGNHMKKAGGVGGGGL